MNIIWKKTDDTLAVTSIFDETTSSSEHAVLLKERGDIDPEWVAVGFDVETFPDWEVQEDFRWVDNAIVISLSSAKESTKSRLRRERAPLLEVQDILFQRALESGSDTTAIVSEKQRLRDITTLADAATTIEELRVIHP